MNKLVLTKVSTKNIVEQTNPLVPYADMDDLRNSFTEPTQLFHSK